MENRLQSLIEQSIDSSALQPNIRLFNQILEIVNNNDEMAKKALNLIKAHINEENNYKSQLQLLELIEYLTCKNNKTIHSGFNSKTFLKSINLIFSKENLNYSVKEKTLYLIQFWNRYFTDNKKLTNFNWYYNIVKNKGIPFPKEKNSSYEIEKFSASKNNKVNQNLLTTRQKKLYKDLQVVVDNLEVANSLITEKEKTMAKELLVRLNEMDKRLSKLPDILLESNEEFLYSYTMAIIEDLGNTKKRYTNLSNGQKIPAFNSRREIVIKRFNNKQKRFKNENIERIDKSENFDSLPESYEKSRNMDIIEEEDDLKKSEEVNDPFNKLDNVYHSPPSREQFKNSTSDVTLKMLEKSKLEVGDFDLLDMNPEPEEKQQMVQEFENNIKFGPNKNQEFDLNLLDVGNGNLNSNFNPNMNMFLNNNPPVQQYPNIGNNYNQQNPNYNQQNPNLEKKVHYKPKNIITFEKVEKEKIKEKIEYDPFSFFNEKELLNSGNKNKGKDQNKEQKINTEFLF